ncbi:BTAD domain-containing putative transcriptional regulator [Streptomyces sp. I05A-00742]|uniref:AfsR/SARP family transcriptional regulator n=1 Tax=Streptomyces sp. I05A-00742 TaxID=2732853 RepID=UPI0028A085C3|nr:BTAD domain-containing putative transcriptional regulator [Streptomyces sp. I05A-00742]
MAPRLSFKVLGPLKASVDGRPLLLRSARQRTVLAVLLLTPGRAVSVDALADAVWHSDPPVTARNQIAICVSALRKTFRDKAGVHGLIETQPPGYVLHREGHYVDVADLYESAAAARAAVEAGNAGEAAARFEHALALWSGPVLDGMDGSALSGAVGRISELRANLIEEYAAVQLQRGRYRSVVECLGPVVAEHPLRESSRAALMRAYHLSGRRSEALDCYREGRRVLVAELGVEPGVELRELHRTVLEGDGPAPVRAEVLSNTVVPDAAPGPAPVVVSHPFPVPPEPFVGRERELELLEPLVPAAPGYAGGTTARIAVVCGPAGVGKSALALHWADRVAGRFPDGRLHLDLQDPSGRGGPGTPEAALERALRALGVPGTSIPVCPEERAALYHSTLDGRRVLVVLDGARSVDQIRPLIPGRGPARALVTSRDPLNGLAGAFAVTRVELGAMSPAESLDLLAATIGEHRVAAEPAAARRLVDLCDRLPPALRVVATRLLSDHRWSLRQMAARMEDRRERVSVLSPGESGVRSGVWLGYRALSVRAARLYRQLSMLDVPDFPAWIGVPVLGVTPDASEELLHRLVGAQLLEIRAARDGTARFRFQDVMRLFARERCLAEDSAQEREQTLERVLTAVLTLVYAAQEQLYGKGEAPRGPAHTGRIRGETVSELVADPIEWFEGERETLGALVAQAVRDGQAERAWLLAVGSVPFYEIRNYLEDWRRTAECALEGARRAGDTRGAGTMLRSLGTLAIYQRRYEEARELLLTALAHLERSDDTQGRAIVRRNLAVCARFFGDLAEAARYCEESLTLFRRAGDDSGLSHALGLLAQIEIEQGDPERGVELSNQAIEVSYEAGSLRSRTQNLYRLAEALLGAGRPAQAERICHDVVGLTRGQGDRLGEAHGLCVLGEAQWRQHEPHKARASLLLALRLAEEVGDRFLQARIVTHLACAEAIRGGTGAGEPLGWAQKEFRTLNAPMWERRVGRLREVLESHDTVRPIEGSVLVCLLAGR